MTAVVEPALHTEHAGTLNNRDPFKFQPGGPGTSWGVYTFLGHVVTEDGHEWVDCYGGDPDPKGCRSWRSFDASRVRKEARSAPASRRTARAG